MDLTTFVDVAIGLVVMYLGASLFVTIVNEYIAQVFQLRARQLKKDLGRLIDNSTVLDPLRQNPALEPFFPQKGQTAKVWRRAFEWLKAVFRPLPKAASFVDPNVLAQQLVGGLLPGSGSKTTKEVLDALEELPDGSKITAQIKALARTGAEKTDEFVQKVGAYLDRTLTAMGEVYKRKLQLISLGVGLLIAVAFNLDSLVVAKHLYRDKEAREATVAVAVELTKKTDRELFDECMAMDAETRRKTAECSHLSGLVDAVLGRNETLGKLPIGWKDAGAAGAALNVFDKEQYKGALARWLGLLLTALAVSLGASFWFDLLIRLVNIRHGMRKPEVDTTKKK